MGFPPVPKGTSLHQALPAFDLDGFLPYRFTLVAERLSNRLARRYRTEYGISVPEWRVLVHLAHSGMVSVRDIEKRVSLEKSKVSRAAKRLEAQGYISKATNESDRRLLHLALTDKGRELMSHLVPLAAAYQRKLEGVLDEHLAALNAALDRLLMSET